MSKTGFFHRRTTADDQAARTASPGSGALAVEDRGPAGSSPPAGRTFLDKLRPGTAADETDRVRIPATTVPREGRHAAGERTADRQLADRQLADQRTVDLGRDTDDTVPTVAETAPRAHTSVLATLALMAGLTAVLATLSGPLAPLGIALGIVGLVLSIGGLTAVARPRVTGHHVVILGLLLSVAAVVLGTMVVNDALPWLDGGTDQAARVREWLDARLAWMSRW